MSLRIPSLSILACGLLLCASAWGQSPSEDRIPPAAPLTPTTRILAIGTIAEDANPARLLAILPDEARETVKLYLEGKIDQWYSLQSRRGVVFVLNSTDAAAAHDMLEKLPLGQAHLMSFELLPLGPLHPLRQLPGIRSTQSVTAGTGGDDR